MNNENFLILLLFLIIFSTTAMEKNLDEESLSKQLFEQFEGDIKPVLEQFFKQWEGNEYHAIKFVEAAKSSPKIKIDYFNNEIRIATFNKKTKTVTTYLPSGEMYHRSFKEFKKLMESKLNIDDEKRKHKKLKKIMKLIKIDGKKYKHFQSIAHLFKKD
jgi:hypothetical protein